MAFEVTDAACLVSLMPTQHAMNTLPVVLLSRFRHVESEQLQASYLKDKKQHIDQEKRRVVRVYLPTHVLRCY